MKRRSFDSSVPVLKPSKPYIFSWKPSIFAWCGVMVKTPPGLDRLYPRRETKLFASSAGVGSELFFSTSARMSHVSVTRLSIRLRKR
jgi:hypothetical protein